MNVKLKEMIRKAAFDAVNAALEGVDIGKEPKMHLYVAAVEAAKSGASEALFNQCKGNQCLAAKIGGLNRSTLRTNLKRADVIF